MRTIILIGFLLASITAMSQSKQDSLKMYYATKGIGTRLYIADTIYYRKIVVYDENHRRVMWVDEGNKMTVVDSAATIRILYESLRKLRNRK